MSILAGQPLEVSGSGARTSRLLGTMVSVVTAARWTNPSAHAACWALTCMAGSGTLTTLRGTVSCCDVRKPGLRTAGRMPKAPTLMSVRDRSDSSSIWLPVLHREMLRHSDRHRGNLICASGTVS